MHKKIGNLTLYEANGMWVATNPSGTFNVRVQQNGANWVCYVNGSASTQSATSMTEAVIRAMPVIHAEIATFTHR